MVGASGFTTAEPQSKKKNLRDTSVSFVFWYVEIRRIHRGDSETLREKFIFFFSSRFFLCA